MAPKQMNPDFLCPKCNIRAKFIRTRYFIRGTADVYMCRNKKCTYYTLYFYNDHPTKQNERSNHTSDNHQRSDRTG